MRTARRRRYRMRKRVRKVAVKAIAQLRRLVKLLNRYADELRAEEGSQ